MESLMFLLDSVIMVIMLFLGLFDEKRPAREPFRSIFRYSVTAKGGTPKPVRGRYGREPPRR